MSYGSLLFHRHGVLWGAVFFHLTCWQSFPVVPTATFFPSCFLSRGSAALHRLPILYPTAGALFVDIQIKIIRNEPRCEAVPDFLKYNNQE